MMEWRDILIGVWPGMGSSVLEFTVSVLSLISLSLFLLQGTLMSLFTVHSSTNIQYTVLTISIPYTTILFFCVLLFFIKIELTEIEKSNQKKTETGSIKCCPKMAKNKIAQKSGKKFEMGIYFVALFLQLYYI